MNNPWIILDNLQRIMNNLRVIKKGERRRFFFFRISDRRNRTYGKKKWPLVLFFFRSDHFCIVNNPGIIINNQRIIRLLTMWKWSDQEENRTSGHFFLPFIPYLRSKMQNKILWRSPFLWSWDFFKIIQDYSWIIVVVEKEGTFLWPRKGPFRFTCQ